MTRQRRHFTPEQKVGVLREHFLDKVPVSDLCEKYGIGVTLFYSWQMSEMGFFSKRWRRSRATFCSGLK